MVKENKCSDLSICYASLCREVENSGNLKVSTPKDFELLSDIIQRSTGVLLSPTTLKRIWGYVNESVTPRRSTLDVLARFCGWKDYEHFTRGKIPDIESGNIGSSSIKAGENIQPGERIKLFWNPSRVCTIEYLGNLEWKVVSATATRLSPGDKFRCAIILSGEPLYLDNLIKNGNRAGIYVCGRKSGVSFERLRDC